MSDGRDQDEERDLLFALFDDAPATVTFLEGPELRLTRANRRVRESVDLATVLGKPARELVRGDTQTLEILEKVYATGEGQTLHAMSDRGWNEARYITRNFSPIRGRDGRVRGVMNLSYDVTPEVRERIAHQESEKRSQAELQRIFALLDEAPVILSVLESPDWHITLANRQCRQLMASEPTLNGTRLRDLVKPDNRMLAVVERVYATGRSEVYEFESELPAMEGRSFSTTFVPIRDADGTSGRVMVAALETTAQRRAHESLARQAADLERARAEAVEAGRAKDQFLAMLGHELRNPLAPMLTAVQVMELEGTSSPALGTLERQIQHLTRLVDDLLDISRIARGMVVLNRERLEIGAVVNRALELARPLLDQRGHRVVIDLVHRELGVSADPDRLAQVVANLVTNAAKYSEPESQIRIVGQRRGERIVVSVSDDGIGIAREMLDHVFEPFVQQPQTLDRSHGGLGLGLSIVKSLVEAHGGTVTARSEGAGHGSTFTIELPAVDSAPAREAKKRPASRVATAPLRILIVDDNYEAADILEIALGALGHDIAIAYNGPSALEIARAHKPQIALVDLGLPVMDGYCLAERLRAEHDIPIVAVTGYGQQSDRHRTYEAGFAAHLVKPVDLHELAALVTQLCSADENV